MVFRFYHSCFILDVCVEQGSSSVQMTSVSLQAECVMDTMIAPLEQMKQYVQVEVIKYSTK